MNSTNRHEHQSEPAGRFAILTVGDNEAALWARTLGNAEVRRLSGGAGDAGTAQLQLLALNEAYEAVFVAGIGAGTHDALELAAGFPELVHGVILMAPEFRPTQLSRMAANVGYALTAAARRLAQSVAPVTDLITHFTHGPASSAHLSLGEVMQPVLIFHPRAGRNAAIKVAATLQRHLGGPVEVQFVGPGAEIELMSPLHPALSRRCSDFTARVATGAEGRRTKRQRAADRSAAPTATAKPVQPVHIPANPASFAENLALTPPHAIA